MANHMANATHYTRTGADHGGQRDMTRISGPGEANTRRWRYEFRDHAAPSRKVAAKLDARRRNKPTPPPHKSLPETAFRMPGSLNPRKQA